MKLEISRQSVLKKLAMVFPDPTIVVQALNSLDTYGNSEFQPAREGVQLAILKLCEGQLWRLRELVREAKGDYRDVLYPAQSPEYSRRMKELHPDHCRGLTKASGPKEKEK